MSGHHGAPLVAHHRVGADETLRQQAVAHVVLHGEHEACRQPGRRSRKSPLIGESTSLPPTSAITAPVAGEQADANDVLVVVEEHADLLVDRGDVVARDRPLPASCRIRSCASPARPSAPARSSAAIRCATLERGGEVGRSPRPFRREPRRPARRRRRARAARGSLRPRCPRRGRTMILLGVRTGPDTVSRREPSAPNAARCGTTCAAASAACG